nr:stromal 70 kda heat shock-related protein, chloroplastic [Quercus suber]
MTTFYLKLRAKSVVLRVLNEKVDGIDLGATNSAMEGGKLNAEFFLNMLKNDGPVTGPLSDAHFTLEEICALCGIMLDVSTLSLGLETLGGVMTKIIPRNTTLPTSKSEVFSTATDGQTSVDINVFQGEREFVRDNRYLHSFRLDDILPASCGVPQIKMKFCINSNGILSVTAVDKGTGKKQGITIINLSNDYEMQRMVNEVEWFAKDYKEKRDAIDIKNQAEFVVYQTENQLKELGETRFLP